MPNMMTTYEYNAENDDDNDKMMKVSDLETLKKNNQLFKIILNYVYNNIKINKFKKNLFYIYTNTHKHTHDKPADCIVAHVRETTELYRDDE